MLKCRIGSDLSQNLTARLDKFGLKWVFEHIIEIETRKKNFIDCNSWLPIYVIVMLCCKSSCNHAALLKENGPKAATAAVEARIVVPLGFSSNNKS